MAPIAVVIYSAAEEKSHVAAEFALEINEIFAMLLTIILAALQSWFVEIRHTIWTN